MAKLPESGENGSLDLLRIEVHALHLGDSLVEPVLDLGPKIFRVGFVGDSSQTSFVLAVIIDLNFLISVKSEKSTLIPVFGPRIILKYL